MQSILQTDKVLVFCFWSNQLNSFFVHKKVADQKEAKTFGDGGYRSPYLSHAKRALYHLSYVPRTVSCGTKLGVSHPKFKVILGELHWHLAWTCRLQHYTSLDSSVGRAVDCSCNCQTSIGRWFKSGSREFFHGPPARGKPPSAASHPQTTVPIPR